MELTFSWSSVSSFTTNAIRLICPIRRLQDKGFLAHTMAQIGQTYKSVVEVLSIIFSGKDRIKVTFADVVKMN